MPHLRKRHILALIKKTLQYSPIVALFGLRQVGKTTLVASIANKYITFDNIDSLSSAMAMPENFLIHNQASPLVIDECQMAPPLFPAMKEWVRTRKTPGQFLLTGSIRFSSRKVIQESLTGRIIAWELLPMDVAEHARRPLPDSLIKILNLKNFETKIQHSDYFSLKVLNDYYKQGGLPGHFSIREESIRVQKFETQINTILERDLRLITQTNLSYRSLKNLLVSLAKFIGKPFNTTDLAKETRITPPTLRKLVEALQAMFVIRFIEPKGETKKPLLFFEDIGMANHLAQNENDENQMFTSFLYQNIRTQIFYRPELQINQFTFQFKNGRSIPLCYSQKENILGIIPISHECQLEEAIKTSRFFINHHKKAKVLIVQKANVDELIDKNVKLIGAAGLV